MVSDERREHHRVKTLSKKAIEASGYGLFGGVLPSRVSHMNRFLRLQKEFGTKALIRAAILLLGLLGMTLFDYFAFSSVKASLIVVIGLALGFLFRRKIAVGVEYYPRVMSVGLFVYSIVLFLGEQLGLEKSTRLAIITATTVVIFDLQFWSLSDSSVVNAGRDMSKAYGGRGRR
jgi:hypothetical protein